MSLLGTISKTQSTSIKNSLETAHRNYVDNLLNTDIKENPKRFYGYIKPKKSGTSNIKVPHTNILSEPTEKAESLRNKYT